MVCSEFRASYSDFADGLLDEIQEIAAHRHMSECPPCRAFHAALQWGVAELRREPRVLPSEGFQERLERRIRTQESGFAPLTRSWPGAAAVLSSLTLIAAATFGWEVSRGGVAQHEFAADLEPPVVSGIYTPRQLRVAWRATPHSAALRGAISFDTIGLSASPRGGEVAAAWSAP